MNKECYLWLDVAHCQNTSEIFHVERFTQQFWIIIMIFTLLLDVTVFFVTK
jgi:hypothetical protein